MDLREAIIGVANAVPIGCLVLVILTTISFRKFLEDVPAIETVYDLDRFKRLAARDMYAALVFILAVTLASVSVAWGLVSGEIGMTDLWLPLAAGGIVIAAGSFLKILEKKVQEVPVSNDELRNERDYVVQTWMTKPFPDW